MVSSDGRKHGELRMQLEGTVCSVVPKMAKSCLFIPGLLSPGAPSPTKSAKSFFSSEEVERWMKNGFSDP